MANKNLETLSNQALLKAEKSSKIILYILGIADIAIAVGILFLRKNDKNYFTVIAVLASFIAIGIEYFKQAKNFKAERISRGI